MARTSSEDSEELDEAGSDDVEHLPVDAEDASPRSPLPRADSTTTRATVAWWFVFLGPAVLTAVLSIAGATAGRGAAVWVFPLGVWAFTLTLGLAATPRHRSSWWVAPVVVAFLAAGFALALLMMVDAAADKMRAGS